MLVPTLVRVGCGPGGTEQLGDWLLAAGSQQPVHNRVPFALRVTVAGRPVGSTVPILGIRQIAFLAMQIGVYPGAVRAFIALGGLVALFQSPLASHHKASNAGFNPCGGRACFSDSQNSVMSMGSSWRYGLPS